MALPPTFPPAPDGSTIALPDYSKAGSARSGKGAPSLPFGQVNSGGQVVAVSTTITTSTAETPVAAGVAGESHHIARIDFQVTAGAAACTASLRSTTGGTVVQTYYLPAALGLAFTGVYSVPLPGQFGANWTIQLSSASPTVIVNIVYLNTP